MTQHTHSLQEQIDIMGEMIKATRYDTSVNAEKEIRLKLGASYHEELVNLWHQIRDTNDGCHYNDGAFRIFYLCSREILKLFPLWVVIKINNQQIDEKLADSISDDIIYKMVIEYRCNYYLKILRKYKTMILDQLKDHIRGINEVYNRKEIEELLSFKELSHKIYYINDMLLYIPNDPKSTNIKIKFSCNIMDISNGSIYGDTNLLSTVAGIKGVKLAKELATHSEFDVDFDLNIIKYIEDNNDEESILSDIGRFGKCLKKIYKTQRMEPLDENVPKLCLDLLYEGRASVAMEDGKKSTINNRLWPCNVCGKETTSNYYVWCKIHGHCHVKCVCYGSLCCPHC